MKGFEEYLMDKHGEQYVGTKDCMIEDYEEWLQDLSADEWIDLANKFSLKELNSVNSVISIRIDRIKAELKINQ